MKNNLAVNLAPREILKKSCAKRLNRALRILFISNRQQNMADSELLLDKYQNKSLGKGFIQPVNRAWLYKCIQYLKICNGNLS